jgi:hypothetical protein
MDLVTQFLQNTTTQQNIRELIKQVGHLVFDEIYLYVWFLCLYNVLLLFMVSMTLYILLRQHKPLASTSPPSP